MFPRFIAAAFAVLICFLIGCAGTSKTVINQESVPYFTEAKILNVTMMNGEVMTFDTAGAHYHERYKNKQRVIVGRTDKGQNVVIALDNVRNARFENSEAEMDARGMFFPTFLIVALLVAIL